MTIGLRSEFVELCAEVVEIMDRNYEVDSRTDFE